MGHFATLRSQNEDTKNRFPIAWSEWVTAFTNLFSPANHISLLARTIASLQRVEGESVDTFSLRVTRTYACVLAESQRTAPTKTTAYEHSWHKSMIVSFENGRPRPHLRIEMITRRRGTIVSSISNTRENTRAKRNTRQHD